MTTRDPDRISIFLGADMRAEMEAEAARLDRKLSWVIRKSWELARAQIAAMAGPPVIEPKVRRKRRG